MTNDAHQSDRDPESAALPADAARPEETMTVSDGAAARDDPPLPPLPDGGLAAVMPAWLSASEGHPTAATAAAVEAIDPASFLDEDDLPTWLQNLVAHDRRTPTSVPPVAAPAAAAPARTVELPPRPPNLAGSTNAAANAPLPTGKEGNPDSPRLVPGAAMDGAPRAGSLLPTLIVLALVLLVTLTYLLATGLL